MLEIFARYLQFLHLTPALTLLLSLIISLILVASISFIISKVVKAYLLRFIRAVLSHSQRPVLQAFLNHCVFQKLAHFAPALFIYISTSFISTAELPLSQDIAGLLHIAAAVYMLLVVTLSILAGLNAIYEYTSTLPAFEHKPIRCYTQVIKIIIWLFCAVLLFSLVLGKSPWAFLTGLGALSAVLMLVFKDTILGFVASIQVSAYDLVRVGDWVVIPKHGANGTVLEVSVNTVKVQNFDHTIVTVPTYDLVSQGVQNWRGMTESGGRRIKRSILIDIDTIKFCGDELLAHLKKLRYLQPFLDTRLKEIENHNQNLDLSLKANGRALTNIGLFRAYVEAYLRNHPNIAQSMTFLVRHLQPTDTGLPLEIYVFSNDTNWVNYEGIQADIFDHLLAVLPEFELKAFQRISSHLQLRTH